MRSNKHYQSPLPLYTILLREGAWSADLLKWLNPLKAMTVFTTCWDVAQVRLIVFIQGEAPGSFLLIPWVAAVGVPSVQLWEAEGGEGVCVWVLGIPRLALAPWFGHTDSSPVVHTCAVIALVIWKTQKKSPNCEREAEEAQELPASSFWREDVRLPSRPRLPWWDTERALQWHSWEDLQLMLQEENQSSTSIFDIEHRKESELGWDLGALESFPSEWCRDCFFHFCTWVL